MKKKSQKTSKHLAVWKQQLTAVWTLILTLGLKDNPGQQAPEHLWPRTLPLKREKQKRHSWSRVASEHVVIKCQSRARGRGGVRQQHTEGSPSQAGLGSHTRHVPRCSPHPETGPAPPLFQVNAGALSNLGLSLNTLHAGLFRTHRGSCEREARLTISY